MRREESATKFNVPWEHKFFHFDHTNFRWFLNNGFIQNNT